MSYFLTYRDFVEVENSFLYTKDSQIMLRLLLCQLMIMLFQLFRFEFEAYKIKKRFSKQVICNGQTPMTLAARNGSKIILSLLIDAL